MTFKENNDRFWFACKTYIVNRDSSEADSRLTQPMALGAEKMGQ